MTVIFIFAFVKMLKQMTSFFKNIWLFN